MLPLEAGLGQLYPHWRLHWQEEGVHLLCTIVALRVSLRFSCCRLRRPVGMLPESRRQRRRRRLLLRRKRCHVRRRPVRLRPWEGVGSGCGNVSAIMAGRWQACILSGVCAIGLGKPWLLRVCAGSIAGIAAAAAASKAGLLARVDGVLASHALMVRAAQLRTAGALMAGGAPFGKPGTIRMGASSRVVHAISGDVTEAATMPQQGSAAVRPLPLVHRQPRQPC